MKNDNRTDSVFSKLSDKDLYSYYRSENWNTLSGESKQALLQETANREIQAYGGNYSVNVRLGDLDENVFGVQQGNNVTLSRDLVESGKAFSNYGDEKIEYDVPGSSWKSLETVFHEVRHSWQNEVSAGRLTAEAGMKETFEANNFTVSDVGGKPGLQYMTGETSFDWYLLNPTEIDANAYAQGKTLSIVQEMEREGFLDPGISDYQKELEVNGIFKELEDMKEKYGEDIVKDVENTLKNTYNGTKEPVSPHIESAVKAEMAASYQEVISGKCATVSVPSGKDGINNSNFGVLANDENNSGILDNNPEDFDGIAPSLAVEAPSSVETSGSADGTGEVETEGSASLASDSSFSEDGADEGLD